MIANQLALRFPRARKKQPTDNLPRGITRNKRGYHTVRVVYRGKELVRIVGLTLAEALAELRDTRATICDLETLEIDAALGAT